MIILEKLFIRKQLFTLILGCIALFGSTPLWAMTPEEIVKLTIDGGNSFMGWSVDVDGNTAVVGAPRQWTANGRGTAYIYVQTGGDWVLEQQLIPPDDGAGK